MKKLNESTVSVINKGLLVVILVFLVLAAFVQISTITPRKHKASTTDINNDGDDNSMLDSEGQSIDIYNVQQEHEIQPGFKIKAGEASAGEPNIPEKDQGFNDERIDETVLFPDSYKEKLSESQVKELDTVEKVQDAINYIYARSGCIFGNEKIQAFYEGFDWYEGRYNLETMNRNPLGYLSEIQYENIELLAKYREKLKK